jgi:hypothetical protein
MVSKLCGGLIKVADRRDVIQLKLIDHLIYAAHRIDIYQQKIL